MGQLLFLHLVLQCFPRQLHNKEKTNVNNLKLVDHFITERMKTNEEVRMADSLNLILSQTLIPYCPAPVVVWSLTWWKSCCFSSWCRGAFLCSSKEQTKAKINPLQHFIHWEYHEYVLSWVLEVLFVLHQLACDFVELFMCMRKCHDISLKDHSHGPV